jgi:hypothetical protein
MPEKDKTIILEAARTRFVVVALFFAKSRRLSLPGALRSPQALKHRLPLKGACHVISTSAVT